MTEENAAPESARDESARDESAATDDPAAASAVTCSWCGAAADPMPLTWTSSTERDGRVRLYCERCSRENLRSIEGRLDSEWW